MWNRLLIWLGARKAATMTVNQAIRAYVSRQMTLEAAAAACGRSVAAFRAQLAAAGYLARGGFVAVTASGLAATVLVLSALAVGGWMYVNKDKPSSPPVEAGWNMRYWVVATEGPQPIYSVRTEGAVAKGIAWSRFRHGGVSDEPAALRRVSGPHVTVEDATRDLARRVRRGSLHKPPLAPGLVGVVDGRTATIDDWGHTDVGLLRRLVQ